MNKLVNDISEITGVSLNALYELIDKSQLIIAHDVFENLKEKNSQTTLDIGIGTLYIKLEDEKIKYKFIPSKNLDKLVYQAATQKSSPLANRAELMLNKRIDQTYKELI